MKNKKVIIDSICMSSVDMISIIEKSQQYRIFKALDREGAYHPIAWKDSFGVDMGKINSKGLVIPFIEAYILTNKTTNVKISLKKYPVNPNYINISFAGLDGYSERSKLLSIHLKELWSQLQHTKLTRVDIALDWEKIPYKVMKALKSNREPHKYKDSIYFKTKKQKVNKTNYIDIVALDKSKKDKLDFNVNRLRFSFGTNFLNNATVHDLPHVKKKIEKAIKRILSISIKIQKI